MASTPVTEIQGHPAVTHQLVNAYIGNCPFRCDTDRHMMQMSRFITTEAQEWCRRNIEITCYGEHFSLVFWSGARQNKFVVQTIAGQVHVSVTGESWRMWLQRKIQECWEAFKDFVVFIHDTAVGVLQAIAPSASLLGSALKAIGW